MKIQSGLNRLIQIGLLVAVATACGALAKKKKGDDTPTDTTEAGEGQNIVIAGQLQLTGASLALTADAVALTDLSVYCVTFTLPPVAGSGTVSADGKFELSLDASNSSVGCFILKGEEVKGSLVFEDTSKKDLSGANKAGDRVGFAGGKSNLGAIVFDLTTGKAVVDVAKIVSENKRDLDKASAQGIDFTGSYRMTSSGLTLPKGYAGTCPKRDKTQDNNGNNGDDCRGPEEGEPLFVKTITGKSVKDGKPAHAMMLWRSQALFEKCGSKLGFTYAEAKAHGIDLSASGVKEGMFDWDASLVDGWKPADATAQNSQMRMEPVADFKGYPGTKQFFNQYTQRNCTNNGPCTDGPKVQSPGGFQFNANTKDSGCRDASGTPIRLDDWKDMQCTNENLTGPSAGLNKSSCTKTVNGGVVTCVNIGGTFKADGSSIADGYTKFPDDYEIYAAAGALCSSIPQTTPQHKLAQLRCYMDASNGKGGGDSEITTCQRDVRGNWSAKTPEEFLLSTGPTKAKGEHIFELFDYDSPTSGMLRGEEREFRGIQVGNNWTDCEVINVFSLAIKKYEGSNDLLAEMIQVERNVSPKPACVAQVGDNTQKMMFKLTRE